MRRERSDEVAIGTPLGIRKTRSFQRMDEDNRWQAAAVMAIRGYPWKPEPGDDDQEPEAAERVDVQPPEQPLPRPPPEEECVRRVYISRSDVVKYGGTTGCPGCRAVAACMKARNHTETCRARIMEEMRKDIEGKKKVEEAAKRKEDAEITRMEEGKTPGGDGAARGEAEDRGTGIVVIGRGDCGTDRKGGEEEG